jgi:ketosteroid isomerase-like protein
MPAEAMTVVAARRHTSMPPISDADKRNVTTGEDAIRALIERWVRAVHVGDIGRVVADHASDIVMFDVPPPYEGIRGIDAYRESWPRFFEWQASGAIFELESLHVTAGETVAFAYGLLRCGSDADFARDPNQRLRLTIGLLKENGRWTVTHEHHSFTDTSD